MIRARRPARRTHFRKKSGAATVEFALTLPLLLILFVGTFDACSMGRLRRRLDVAAYESARVGAEQDARTADVVACCERLLGEYGIEPAAVETTPSEIGLAPPGTLIHVRVAAQCADVGMFFGPMYRNLQTETTFALQRRTFQP